MKEANSLFIPMIAARTVRAVWKMSDPTPCVLVADPKVDEVPKLRNEPGSLGHFTAKKGKAINPGTRNQRGK